MEPQEPQGVGGTAPQRKKMLSLEEVEKGCWADKNKATGAGEAGRTAPSARQSGLHPETTEAFEGLFFSAALRGTWDLSSQIRDRTHAPCNGSAGPPGKSHLEGFKQGSSMRFILLKTTVASTAGTTTEFHSGKLLTCSASVSPGKWDNSIPSVICCQVPMRPRG